MATRSIGALNGLVYLLLQEHFVELFPYCFRQEEYYEQDDLSYQVPDQQIADQAPPPPPPVIINRSDEVDQKDFPALYRIVRKFDKKSGVRFQLGKDEHAALKLLTSRLANGSTSLPVAVALDEAAAAIMARRCGYCFEWNRLAKRTPAEWDSWLSGGLRRLRW